MTFNPTLTRRQCLAALATTAVIPFSGLQAAAANQLQGALMILRTPYRQPGDVAYEDPVKEV